MSINESNSLNYVNNSLADLINFFSSSMQTGLLSTQIYDLRLKYGFNKLSSKETESIFSKIKEQFSDILVIILLIAAIVSFLTNIFASQQEDLPPWIEPLVIFIILILNALIGIYQDYNAERSLQALAELQETTALVLRDSIWQIVNSKELLPGDIIKLSTGDKIPADARIIELKSKALLVNESILTGESDSIYKTINVENKINTIFEARNMIFNGCFIVHGNCIAIVVSISVSTQIGLLQQQIQNAQSDVAMTPLRLKLSEFGDFLAKAIGILCIIIWLVNIKNFFDPNYSNAFQGALHYFKIAVSLAVAAIPEGLPAVITTCLALGTRKLAAQKAIVRNLASVETLGCTNVICTDKTGTLTTNQMCVKEFCLIKEEDRFEIVGLCVEGWDYSIEGRVEGLEDVANWESLERFCECINLCNESKLVKKSQKKGITVSGLPTEGALKVLAEKIYRNVEIKNNDINYNEILEKYSLKLGKIWTRLAVNEFTHENKTMSVIYKNTQLNNTIAFIKGAPELLIKKSSCFLNPNGDIIPLNDYKRSLITEKLNEYCGKGLRCLALCMNPYVSSDADQESIEFDPILIGLVGMIDPPRIDIKQSVNICKNAGIRLIMATGDIKDTAKEIAIKLDLLNIESAEKNCISGTEFESMEKSAQLLLLSNFLQEKSGLVFYRLEPKHKQLLITLLSSLDQVVAMTGDGVNDAPALKQADIGIAMGRSGTEVAKEASDMILSDDNFNSIVKAIEEGRSIYNNMKAFIRYMISSNIGEVVCIFIGSVLGIPDIFSSVQLLWVNLVTDGLPAMALSFNPTDNDIMIRPPRKKTEPIVTIFVFIRYLIVGFYVGIATVGVFLYWFLAYDWSDYKHSVIEFGQLNNWSKCNEWEGFMVNDEGDFGDNFCGFFNFGKKKASTLSLTVLVTIEMFNALNALSEYNSILDVGILSNIWLIFAISISMMMHCGILYINIFQTIFQTEALSFYDWMIVIGFSAPVIFIDEIVKWHARNKLKGAQHINCCKIE